jgi:Na+-transporting NADH:ubiquinone oxidoreductase subunit F
LWASLLVCGVAAVLAALLVLAERYLVNYGEVTIDLNQDSKRLDVEGGGSLLGTLMNEGIFIPSACGGKGTCSFCKVKVLEGGGPIAPTEEPLLTREEMDEGVRISCQLKVRNDLAVEIPEELFNIREYTGTVERIRDLTHDIKEVRIRLTEPETIEFTAGQYIQLKTPPYEKSPDSVYRAYSVSSPPSDRGHIELIIRLVPGGICTTWVFEHLSEGDEVAFNGPYGDFRLTDTDNEMAWIAGGSGMAPFWSMIRHMIEHDIRRKTTYFFGAVAKRDMFYLDELEGIAREHDWFRFLPALSAPADEDQWEGDTGLITEVVDRHLPGDHVEGYLCGSGGMIDAAVKVLTGRGIPEERIYYDKFN